MLLAAEIHEKAEEITLTSSEYFLVRSIFYTTEILFEEVVSVILIFLFEWY